MQLELFVTDGLGDTSYLIASEGEALVVDPQRDVDRFLRAAEAMEVAIGSVVETHVHNDYLTGALELRAATGAEIVAPAAGGYAFAHRGLREGDELRVGALRVRAIETPGHTPEHLSYLVLEDGSDQPVAVFTGGSLIVGNAGRTDLLGPERARELVRAQYRSLRRLAELPGDVRVLPTHGAGSFCASGASPTERTSTIRRELAANPALLAPDEATFEREQLDGLPAYPTYYREMAPINRTGPPVLGRLPTPPALDPDRFAELSEEAWVVDARARVDFAAGHVPGAVNVELDDDFASYVGWVLPFGSPVLLVVPGHAAATGDGEPERAGGEDRPAAAAALAARALARIGFERIAGYLDGGPAAWERSGRSLDRYETTDLQTLCEGLRAGTIAPDHVLDVRQRREWEDGHLDGSRHAFVGDLAPAGAIAEAGLDEASDGEPWWVICASGHRASVAASLLEREDIPVRLVARGGVARLLRTCADRTPTADRGASRRSGIASRQAQLHATAHRSGQAAQLEPDDGRQHLAERGVQVRRQHLRQRGTGQRLRHRPLELRQVAGERRRRQPPRPGRRRSRERRIEVGQVGQQVLRAPDEPSAIPDQCQRHLRQRARHRPRHREHRPPQIEREVRRDQRTASRRSLHDQHGVRHRGHDAVTGGESERLGRHTGWVLADDRAHPDDAVQQGPAAVRIGDVDPAPEHRDRRPADREGPLVRGAVDPPRSPAHDARPRAREPAAERPRDLRSQRRAVPGPDHRDDRTVKPHGPTADEQRRGRIGEVEHAVREVVVPRHRHAGPDLVEAPGHVPRGEPFGQGPARRVQQPVPGTRRREARRGAADLLGHRPHPPRGQAGQAGQHQQGQPVVLVAHEPRRPVRPHQRPCPRLSSGSRATATRLTRHGPSSPPEVHPVRHRLGQVLPGHDVAALEVRHRPGDLQRAVEPAAGERQRLDGPGEQRLGIGRQPGLPASQWAGQLRVAPDLRSPVPDALPFAGGLHPGPDGPGRLATGLPEQLGLGQPRHRQAEVDAIEERPRQLAPVQFDAVGQAPAVPGGGRPRSRTDTGSRRRPG